MRRLGNVYELKTGRGLAYLQHTYEHPEYGSLIRVLPGLHESRPRDLSEVTKAKELYFVFFPVKAAARMRIVERVETCGIPQGSEKPAVMRRPGARAQDGRVKTWFINNGKSETLVTHLNEDQRDLSIMAIWNDTLLISRIESEWQPSHEV